MINKVNDCTKNYKKIPDIIYANAQTCPVKNENQ